jgi:hypothetical protein
MGGRALKNVETRRYSREEFDTVSKKLVDTLSETFEQVDVPLFYTNKESFGDIDIIISNEDVEGEELDGSFVREYIKVNFNPNEIFHNGNSWSFDYKEVQIDLILVDADDFDSNYHYLAYNDLGNFIGRLAQSIGVKFGQEGLWYNRYGKDNSTKHKIMISKDYRKIYSFLGLDYDRFLEGFEGLEDIFKFTTTSHLFNPERFKLSNLNKVNRERNLKRKSYMSFLEYIEGMGPNHDYDKEYIEVTKENIVDILIDHFPEANIEYYLAVIDYKEAVDKLVKLKFNGGMIKDMYNLEGKEIGDAIRAFQEYINTVYVECEIGDNFNNYIINTSEYKIWKTFEIVNMIN